MASTSKEALEKLEAKEGKENAKKKIPRKITDLSPEEREKYDRQIRLWGLESQKALRSANILLIGLSGCGAEILKNILLTGVDSIILLDDKAVTEDDFDSQYFLPSECLGVNRAEAIIRRAQKLNTTVKLIADKDALSQKDESYFEKFDVIIATGITNSEILRLNEICRKKGIKFCAGDVWGVFGWFFLDLQDHEYLEDFPRFKEVEDPEKPRIKSELVTVTVRRYLSYPSYKKIMDFDISQESFAKNLKRTGPALILLKVLLAFRDKYKRNPDYRRRSLDIMELQSIRDEISNKTLLGNEYFGLVFGQVAPANAVMAGVLAQEIIKAITRKGPTINNVFLFDPINFHGFVERIE